uniref:Uncharacterized protein n=1 Tax=viral metagenome TaxID=1070528 RepID=A0A6C0BVC8_9ZZZZ
MDHADHADRMLMNLGDPDEAFQETVSININEKKYYGKKIISPENAQYSLDMWNTLYNPNTGLLLRINETPLMNHIYNNEKYLFFSELGNEVTENCKNACKIAQEKLENIGYFHTDLYYNDYYNCNNVRKVNEDYYPIDVFKIVKKLDGGKRKKTNRKKTKRKKTKRKKTKRKKTKRKKINDL